MLIFVRKVALLIVFFAAVIGAAVLIPRLSGPYRIAWLDDYKSCELPCWRGITPGVTTADEAVRLLRAMPDISITLDQGRDNGRSVAFIMKNERMENFNGGFYAPLNKTVPYISFIGKQVKLVNLIARFRNPENVNDRRDGDTYDIDYLYNSKNIMARTTNYAIMHDFQRYCPLYRFQATVEIDLGALSQEDIWDHISYWKGFNQTLDYLCTP